ncbi:DUF6473 family protein [Gymnodinialimonas sp. 2305UL16-5]|uniref:DUF6473 family protein n=1 Tax=Gymnodinialimonas mytili TaxID=3126503 RepID=UPI00309732D1
MSFEQRGRMPLDYHTAALPGSPLRFRGPISDSLGPCVVCVGGSETFGRFIHAPFASQLDSALPQPVLNLGVVNAGLDVLTNDVAIGSAMAKADAVVLQITSAHNMTNRFYHVHPRRNDRFLKASSMLRTIFPDVDFTEFHFTRHLLSHLHNLSEDRFGIIKTELEAAWVARMRRLIDSIDAPVHLLWLSNKTPDCPAPEGLGGDPLFVSQRMLDAVSEMAASVTIAVPDVVEDADSTKGKFFGPREEAAARLLPGPRIHDRAAAELLNHLS